MPTGTPDRSKLQTVVRAAAIAAVYGCAMTLALMVVQVVIWAFISEGPVVPVLYALVFSAPFAIVIGYVAWLLVLGFTILLGWWMPVKSQAWFWPVAVACMSAILCIGISYLVPTLVIAPLISTWSEHSRLWPALLTALLYAFSGYIAGRALRKRLRLSD